MPPAGPESTGVFHKSILRQESVRLPRLGTHVRASLAKWYSSLKHDRFWVPMKADFFSVGVGSQFWGWVFTLCAYPWAPLAPPSPKHIVSIYP